MSSPAREIFESVGGVQAAVGFNALSQVNKESVADYVAYRLGELSFEKGDKVNAAVYF